MNSNIYFDFIGLTLFGIKPEFKASEARALSTPELFFSKFDFGQLICLQKFRSFCLKEQDVERNAHLLLCNRYTNRNYFDQFDVC